MTHDPRCDHDLCHPDCSIRRRAIENDAHYPGRRTEVARGVLDDGRAWSRVEWLR